MADDRVGKLQVGVAQLRRLPRTCRSQRRWWVAVLAAERLEARKRSSMAALEFAPLSCGCKRMLRGRAAIVVQGCPSFTLCTPYAAFLAFQSSEAVLPLMSLPPGCRRTSAPNKALP